MRKSGLCLALIASAPLVLFSVPSYADGDTPSAAAAPAPAAAPAAATASDGTVAIHLNSDSPVTLQHRSGENSAWETLCTSPCDAKGPVGDQYLLTGEGLNDSKVFNIDGSKGKVTLDVSPGSKKKAVVGTGFLIGGGVVLLTGLIWAIAESSGPLHADTNSPGFLSGAGSNDGGTTHIDHTNGLFAAGALIFAGVCAGLYGAGTMLANRHTDVDGDVAKDQPSRGENDVPTRTAQIKLPTPTFSVPLFQGSF
jgi:hypothetical protein